MWVANGSSQLPGLMITFSSRMEGLSGNSFVNSEECWGSSEGLSYRCAPGAGQTQAETLPSLLACRDQAHSFFFSTCNVATVSFCGFAMRIKAYTVGKAVGRYLTHSVSSAMETNVFSFGKMGRSSSFLHSPGNPGLGSLTVQSNLLIRAALG